MIQDKQVNALSFKMWYLFELISVIVCYIFNKTPNTKICKSVIKANIKNIRFIRSSHPEYEDLCFFAIEHLCCIMRWYDSKEYELAQAWKCMSNTTAKVNAKVISYCPEIFEKVEHTEELFNAMFDCDVSLIRLIPNPTREMIWEAISKHPELIWSVEQWPELCEMALRSGKANIYMKIKDRSEELLVLALSNVKSTSYCYQLANLPTEELMPAILIAIEVNLDLMKCLTASKRNHCRIRLPVNDYIKVALAGARYHGLEPTLKFVRDQQIRKRVSQEYSRPIMIKNARKI